MWSRYLGSLRWKRISINFDDVNTTVCYRGDEMSIVWKICDGCEKYTAWLCGNKHVEQEEYLILAPPFFVLFAIIATFIIPIMRVLEEPHKR